MPTVGQYLESLGDAPYRNLSESSEVPQYQSFSDAGLTLEQMLSTPTPFFGGLTPSQNLANMGATDPMNQLDFALPEATGSLIPSSTDMGGFLLAAAPLLAMTGGFAGVGGLSNAGGGAAGASIPELGLVANPATANAAIAGGIPSSMLSGGAGALGLGGLPSGTSSLVNQLVKALAGGSSTGSGGTLFGQSGTPGGSSYMRKASPPLNQPAFLGEQGQQPLGSVEDAAFNEMVAGRSEDTSNRARQMAAQLRGRPSILGFRS